MELLFDFHCTKCQRTYEDYCEKNHVNDMFCPACGNHVERVFSPIMSIWKCGGSHKAVYTKYGRKDQTPKEYYQQREKLQKAGKLEQIPGNNVDPLE